MSIRDRHDPAEYLGGLRGHGAYPVAARVVVHREGGSADLFGHVPVDARGHVATEVDAALEQGAALLALSLIHI